MRRLERLTKVIVVLTSFILSGLLAHQFGTGGLWRGFDPALASAEPGAQRSYDLTRLEAVNETLKYIRDRYVDPQRVKPRQMLLSALDYIQRDVAQVIVLPDGEEAVTIRVDTHEQKLRVDNVQGPWDVAAKLREVFAFLQKHLRDTEVDLREIEYAACNGLLKTLDPHSVFMSPEAYKEMNLSTSGHFGGLGIVISIRDQLLTVLRPMPDTPAGKAGLQRGDRVMKINNESTLNMPLDDAVRRLRGKPGTQVTVWIARDGEPGTKKYVLTRERIEVQSVLSQRLEGGVAYIRLNQFQQTSTAEIKDALQTMRAAGPIQGLVLDLRGNPGGLLEQSATVSDLFLERGVLVATVGASEGREEKRAKAAGTEPDYPMVVLVSGTSASASEIVAGALKNLDRAIIVGETTFGKGSVQLVFPDITRDKAALKLTIAQYLTPGDKSIQGVGVTPHIELDPMTADELEMDLTLSQDRVRERDLSQSLSNSHATQTSKPDQIVRYFLSQQGRLQQRLQGGELEEDEFKLDFPIAFAHELVRKLPPKLSAPEQLRAAAKFIQQVRDREMKKISDSLSLLGVDWSMPSAEPVTGPAKRDFAVKIETDRPGDQVTAGETINLKVTVTNNGSVPVYRLRAVTKSDNPYFDEKELVFGKITPGQTKEATTPLSWCELEGQSAGSLQPLPKDAKRTCAIPKDALTRSDGLKVHFDAAGGHAPASVEVRPTIVALPRPLFQYSYQISDNIRGNGDGRLQRGEQLTMYLTVKNIGPGRSYETQANLANHSGDGVLLRNGRFDISNMMPGDVREVAFTFDVEPQLKDDEAVISLSVSDRDVRESANEKIRIPIEKQLPLSPASGTAKVLRTALVYPDGEARAEAFGRLPSGSVLKLLARRSGVLKVQLAPGRFAFVREPDVEVMAGDQAADAAALAQLYTHAPPTLNVAVDAMATRKDKARLSVEAHDGERLLDMYVFVGQRKLYYQSNRGGADPRRASFTFDAPLRPGVNIITVVARETADTTTRRTVVVRRDAADGSILKTPKHSDELLQP